VVALGYIRVIIEVKY